MPELQQHYLTLEAFSSLLRATVHTTAVHFGCGMTYLPYHKLPYSRMMETFNQISGQTSKVVMLVF